MHLSGRGKILEAIDPDSIHIDVVNDLICIKYENDEWVECGFYDIAQLILYNRDFEKWKSCREVDFEITNDLKEWLEEQTRSGDVSLPIINIKKKILENTNNELAYIGKDEEDEVLGENIVDECQVKKNKKGT